MKPNHRFRNEAEPPVQELHRDVGSEMKPKNRFKHEPGTCQPALSDTSAVDARRLRHRAKDDEVGAEFEPFGEGMIEAAAAIDDSRCSFEVLDVVRHQDRLAGYKADVIVVSGTLNAMEESMAREVLGTAFEACSTALVFNFLSDQAQGDWLKRDLAPASRFDTVGWLGWALGRTSLVRFTQSYYGGHDATIAMFREDPGSEGTG